MKQILASRKEQLFTIFAIFIVSTIAFGTFNSTIISSDDWSYFVAKYVFGNLQPINLTDRRPLILVLYYVLASVFGLRFEYYYFFNYLILFLSALMVYVLVKRAFPEQKWIAGLVALTYLIYPVDYTRTWLIMIYIRFWWLVSLGVIWLLLEFVASGNKLIYTLAMFGIAIPLGAYEGQFGIILLASFLITLFYKKTPIKHRLMLLGSIIAITIAFLFWRTYIQPSFLEINDAYVEALQLNPAILIVRYLNGLRIFTTEWFNPIYAQLKISGVDLIYWSLLYILICSITIIWISSRTAHDVRVKIGQKVSAAKSYIIIFLIGGAFWIAGYIPIILLYSPSLNGNASRVNSYSILGAALMLVSIASILATLLTNSTLMKRFMVISIILPFIFAGIFAQLQVNKENKISWETQKKIWNGVFETIPNIKDQKRIVIIIPGYQQLRPFETYPFLSGWEIEAGTQVLYNNPNISGNFYYKDIVPTNLLFTKNGFRPIQTDRIIPYKKLIFVNYDPQSSTVEVVENLERELQLPFSVTNYNPYENIAPVGPTTADFRGLIR
ncbi:MAG: hypothetical protein LUQ26_15165 [Methylococcaceae bacterium]|nr:hypothetical protein [Methylococcaceae bacterium]